MNIRTTLLFCALITTQACTSIFERPRLTPRLTPHYDICVFNDTLYPVPEDVMRRTLREASISYFDAIGIRFTVLPGIHPFSSDESFRSYPNRRNVEFVDIPTLKDPLSSCATKPDFAILFTNALYGSIAGTAPPGADTVAYIALFEANFLSRVQDNGGHNALTTVLVHEFGHHFGVNHIEDTRSFMHRWATESNGEWTPEVIRTIQEFLSR